MCFSDPWEEHNFSELRDGNVLEKKKHKKLFFFFQNFKFEKTKIKKKKDFYLF